MLKNYLTVALRGLMRNKFYVLNNTLGMGIAMACCLTAYLLIAYNIEFDSYFTDAQVGRVVKVMHYFDTPEGEQERELVVPMDLAPLAVQEVAGIEGFTRFCNTEGSLSYKDNAFYENIRFADASFFELFPLGLKRGSYAGFQDRQSIYLSDALATKYFGDDDPVGRSMMVEVNNKPVAVVVGGVLERLPLNISFHIDALMRMEMYQEALDIVPNRWDTGFASSVLFKLAEGVQPDVVGRQLDKYVRLLNRYQKERVTRRFELLPFRTPVINGEVGESDLRLPIPTTALVVFGVLGLIILLIAGFNLANTTLALTGRRLKEIGVRKVVGSGRRQIIYQFLLEMAITVALSVMAGVVMAQFIVPQFALMWQLEYGLKDLSVINFALALLVLLVVAAVLAGVYPAVLNSRFNPIELLRSKRRRVGTSYLSRVLLVVQFALSVMVLLAGIVFIQNAAYQQQLDLGYAYRELVTVAVPNRQAYELLSNRLTGLPVVEDVAGAGNSIGPYTAGRARVKLDTTTLRTTRYVVGAGYLHTAGLTLTAGRDFSPTDDSLAVIVDENFVSNHQLNDPLGAKLIYDDKPYRIIGIVTDHLSGLKQKKTGDHMYMAASPDQYRTLMIRTSTATRQDVLQAAEKEWKALFAGKPFEGKLQEDVVFGEANVYNHNLTRIFFFITVLGTLLSASGIYALASLNVQRRTREIGIRKVMGAGAGSIVSLLNREFAVMLVIAAVVGCASGVTLTRALLDDLYAQHSDIGWAAIVLSGAVVVTIGIMATTSIIFKAAMTNPTQTLRSE